MNAVVSRMIWKEFYALRMVWVLCVLGVLGLNGMITVYAAAYHWPGGFSTVFWGLAMVVPAAYVVACTAMTFSGEREDRTADWLVALSPPFASLYVSKQLFLVVSGLAMQVFLAAAAACFSLADRMQPQSLADIWDTLGVTEFVFLECVVWGTFWSLQTARPVQAIFQTIATLIVIFVVSGFSMDLARQHNVQSVGHHGLWGTRGLWYGAFDTWGWLRMTWTVGIVAASWALGQRWLNGRAFEWEAVFGRLFQRRVPKARTITYERAEPWQRTWQRLRWLEWQSLKSFGWMTVTATVLSCVSILFGTYATLAWMVSFCCLLILIGGLQSWRGEQTRQQYRMFVNYGVSPVAVWANKLLMWFMATMLVVAVVGLTTAAFWTLLSSQFTRTFPGYVPGYGPRWPSLFTQFQNSSTNNPTMLWMTASLFVLYGLMMFAAAFMWSLLSRKAVIAFGLALVTLCLLSPWYGIVKQLGMPMWLFLGPLPVWLVWISWRHLTAWWLERTGWRVWLARSLELAVVPAVLVLGAIAYRVYEIPWIPNDAANLLAHHHVPDASTTANNVAAWRKVADAVNALPPITLPDTSFGGAGEGMAAAGGVEQPTDDVPSATEPANGVASTPQAKWLDQWLAESSQPLQELRDALLATQGLMVPEAALWERSSKTGKWQLAFRGLMSQALLTVAPKTVEFQVPIPRTVETDPQTFETRTHTHSESIGWLQSAVRLGGAVRRYGPLVPQYAYLQNDDTLFADMIAWAQHPDQTEATLQQGLQACAAELRLWQVSPADIRASADWERKQDISYWPWEEARQQRLLQVASVNRATYVSQVQGGHGVASLYPRRTFAQTTQITAWDVRPGDDHSRYSHLSVYHVVPVIGLEAHMITVLHDAETRYRGTVTTMAVVGYRRLHGRLPASLTEVAPLFGEIATLKEVMHDPWSQEWFHYEPAGFPLPADSPEKTLKQPLLWSGGANHYEVRSMGDNRLYASSMVMGGLRSSALTDRDLRGLYVFPIPPQTP
ncbi:MAG: hypothetical protein SH850_01355 [Planctomycetaceae bacterium]|nr:hypothetical protein [Planctomycetaceae bacterium]